MTICILSIHALHDNRICKYADSFIAAGCNVVNIHFGGRDFITEKGEVQFPIGANRIIKRFYLYTGYKIIKYLKSILSKNEAVIFHIHDPMVLNLSGHLKRISTNSFIIYDRHEYFEDYRTLKIFKEPRFYECKNKKNIDLLVTVSNSMKDKAGKLFKNKEIIAVNNYPLEDKSFDRNSFYSKKNSVLTISYVGSLNWHGDRDVPLMLKLIDTIENTKIDYRFYIAGVGFDNELVSQFKNKEILTKNKFSFLGSVSRDKAIELTLQSHIGLDFLYPAYSHKQQYSPNKIYEYIYLGTIPFIRIKVADINIKGYTDYSYDKETVDDIILQDFETLVKDKSGIDSKINILLQRKYDLFWGNEFNKLNAELAERIKKI